MQPTATHYNHLATRPDRRHDDSDLSPSKTRHRSFGSHPSSPYSTHHHSSSPYSNHHRHLYSHLSGQPSSVFLSLPSNHLHSKHQPSNPLVLEHSSNHNPIPTNHISSKDLSLLPFNPEPPNKGSFLHSSSQRFHPSQSIPYSSNHPPPHPYFHQASHSINKLSHRLSRSHRTSKPSNQLAMPSYSPHSFRPDPSTHHPPLSRSRYQSSSRTSRSPPLDLQHHHHHLAFSKHSKPSHAKALDDDHHRHHSKTRYSSYASHHEPAYVHKKDSENSCYDDIKHTKNINKKCESYDKDTKYDHYRKDYKHDPQNKDYRYDQCRNDPKYIVYLDHKEKGYKDHRHYNDEYEKLESYPKNSKTNHKRIIIYHKHPANNHKHSTKNHKHPKNSHKHFTNNHKHSTNNRPPLQTSHKASKNSHKKSFTQKRKVSSKDSNRTSSKNSSKRSSKNSEKESSENGNDTSVKRSSSSRSSPKKPEKESSRSNNARSKASKKENSEKDAEDEKDEEAEEDEDDGKAHRFSKDPTIALNEKILMWQKTFESNSNLNNERCKKPSAGLVAGMVNSFEKGGKKGVVRELVKGVEEKRLKGVEKWRVRGVVSSLVKSVEERGVKSLEKGGVKGLVKDAEEEGLRDAEGAVGAKSRKNSKKDELEKKNPKKQQERNKIHKAPLRKAEWKGEWEESKVMNGLVKGGEGGNVKGRKVDSDMKIRDVMEGDLSYLEYLITHADQSKKDYERLKSFHRSCFAQHGPTPEGGANTCHNARTSKRGRREKKNGKDRKNTKDARNGRNRRNERDGKSGRNVRSGEDERNSTTYTGTSKRTISSLSEHRMRRLEGSSLCLVNMLQMELEKRKEKRMKEGRGDEESGKDSTSEFDDYEKEESCVSELEKDEERGEIELGDADKDHLRAKVLKLLHLDSSESGKQKVFQKIRRKVENKKGGKLKEEAFKNNKKTDHEITTLFTAPTSQHALHYNRALSAPSTLHSGIFENILDSFTTNLELKKRKEKKESDEKFPKELSGGGDAFKVDQKSTEASKVKLEKRKNDQRGNALEKLVLSAFKLDPEIVNDFEVIGKGPVEEKVAYKTFGKKTFNASYGKIKNESVRL